MRDLVEKSLSIPVVQTNLAEHIAGATVDTGGQRAIVLNLVGRNKNVFVRRATLAHELCHLVFDPTQRLRELQVDDYDHLETPPEKIADRVEQRANAFAVELLAPRASAVRGYDESAAEDPLGDLVAEYGVSVTAARYQVWNGRQRQDRLDELTTLRTQPEPHWEAAESYTVDYHPIAALGEFPSRAGRFSAVVVRAAKDVLISWDTAAEWLCCELGDLKRAVPGIRDLFPEVFL